MPRQLTTQNATITTAAVEVKTLSVSGKQVTLTVFRQLREEPLIAHDGSFNGLPWGYVNYHPDKCEGDRWAHRHIVWQSGQDLLRARVDDIPDSDTGSRQQVVKGDGRAEGFRCDEANQVLALSVLAWIDGRREKCPLDVSGRYDAQYDRWAILTTEHSFFVPAVAPDAAVAAANLQHKAALAAESLAKAEAKVAAATDAWDSSDWRQKQLQERRTEHQEVSASLSAAAEALRQHVEPFASAARPSLQALIKEEAVRRQRHRDARVALADLPQLFIAV